MLRRLLADHAEQSTSLAGAKPTTRVEWEKLVDDIFDAAIKPYSGRPGFDKFFFPQLLTAMSNSSLRDVDLRKGSTKLRELAEAKVKAEKEAKKTGGNVAKPAVKARPNQVGTSSAKDSHDLKA